MGVSFLADDVAVGVWLGKRDWGGLGGGRCGRWYREGGKTGC